MFVVELHVPAFASRENNVIYYNKCISLYAIYPDGWNLMIFFYLVISKSVLINQIINTKEISILNLKDFK